MNIRKALVLISLAAMMVWARAAFAAEANVRQPLSNDGSTPGAATITSENVGSKTALDVAIATGTINLASTVTAYIETMSVETEPMDTPIQVTPVTLAATATGTISCGGVYNNFTIAHDGAAPVFYSYAGDAKTGVRMIMFSKEKYISPEGLKVTVNTIKIYNPTAVSVNFYLECWR